MKTNSALEWFPKIIKVGLPVPETEIVLYDHDDIEAMLEDGVPSKTIDSLKIEVEKACIKIGYPCFARTDLSSAKHDGEKSYIIKSKDDINRVICNTVSDNEMKFWLTGPTPKALSHPGRFLAIRSTFTNTNLGTNPG